MVRQESSAILQKVCSAKDNRDLKAAYDQWAEKYDADVTAFGYRIPAVAAGMFGKYVTPGTTPILDAGAGTGLMGAILKGYKDKSDALENDGKWQIVEKTNAFPGLPLEQPDLLNRVYVYRVC